jgi:hypothetical protein
MNTFEEKNVNCFSEGCSWDYEINFMLLGDFN